MMELAKLVLTNQQARLSLVRNSHDIFAHVYFDHYFKYAFADFHERIFAHTEDADLKYLVVLAFRNSGKSTILSLSLPIWSIVGAKQKKCILIIGQTQRQARQHLANIKAELSENKLLLEDLGPFEEKEEVWNSGSIVIKQHGARIIALSRDQSVRGMRHLQHRPDLIICDDVEDIESAKRLESRDDTYAWFSNEIVPCGDEGTQFVYVGNLVHEECLIEKLRAEIEIGKLHGVHMRVPILDHNDIPTWPARFPDKQAVDAFRSTIPGDSAWDREYMLRITDKDDRLIRRSDIQYYDTLPDGTPHLLALGTDLAVTDALSADFCASVPIAVYGRGKQRMYYVLSGGFNERLMVNDALQKIATQYRQYSKLRSPKILVENVSFLRMAVNELREYNCRAELVPLHGMSKRERLENPASLIAHGRVLFPRGEAGALIDQLIHFGSAKHDDLCDAFSLAVNYLHEKTGSSRKIKSMHMDNQGRLHFDEMSEEEIDKEEALKEEIRIAKEAKIEKRRRMGVPESNLYDP